jgi:tellurite resistance protein TerC
MNSLKAVWICVAWVVAALLFNGWIYYAAGPQKALEFLTGYTIELSLSIDNLFVFFLIFSHFKVDTIQQNKILTWSAERSIDARYFYIGRGGIA